MIARIQRAYVFAQDHVGAFLNIAIGLLNISFAVDSSDGPIPAAISALFGSFNLFIGGYLMASKIRDEEHLRDWKTLRDMLVEGAYEDGRVEVKITYRGKYRGENPDGS